MARERDTIPLGLLGYGSGWLGPDGDIGAYIHVESENTLAAYRRQPNLIIEHANHEEDTTRGGYAHRQLFELVQNGADALARSSGGRIWIRLTPTHLYCADAGHPIDQDGVRALMFSRLSPKRGTSEIGRFGLGFKSVLGVTDAPDFFSRSGSFRFNREKASELIRRIAPNAERYPVLRLPEAIEPLPRMEADPILRELMDWAANIVRLPLKRGTHEALGRQIRDFPPEFLLFVGHVPKLVLQTDDQDAARIVTLDIEGHQRFLDDGGDRTRWMVFKHIHRLSADGKSDSRSLDDASEVPISWAAPIDRLSEPGHFWAFFPTLTTSLLAGILNAPWKTNEDRQNLLPGIYNDELIAAAADMVANALAQLSTRDDPAKHLDALPRRYEAGDSEHSSRLRDQLHANLQDCEVVPDQDGQLRKLTEISYPPRELTDGQAASDALERWAAYEGRPSDWLHHSAFNRIRLAAIERLRPDTTVKTSYGLRTSPPYRASIAEWLGALVRDAKAQRPPVGDRIVEASMAAVQTAALISESIRKRDDLGKVVLTADGRWVRPDPDVVRLSGGDVLNARDLVHPQLQADHDTLVALKELGLRPASSETVFRDFASQMLLPDLAARSLEKDLSQADTVWCWFWTYARNAGQSAAEVIQTHDRWRETLRVRTIGGSWRTLFYALLPGDIVPADGSRDSNVAIDTQFHEADLRLLRQLGAVDAPSSGQEPSLRKNQQFTRPRRIQFTQRDLPRKPRSHMLNFDKTTTSGPLDVLEALSDEGKALYTWRLLGLSSTYERWTMRHDTQDVVYGSLDFESPALEALRQHGRVTTDDVIHHLADGIGDPPQNRAVFHRLLSHPQARLIRTAFGLPAEIDTSVDPFDADDPMPLVDIWPGLEPHLSEEQGNLQLIHCDAFRRLGGISAEDEYDCITMGSFVYLRRNDDEEHELRSVLRELGLQLSDEQTRRILRRQTSADVRAAREAVRDCPTDEERLLAAAGETELRRGLPQGLLAILRDEQGRLSGVDVARAAIATFHTGALREYRHALDHLDPPRQWAGRPRAVAFVRSLGFGEEWAGDRNARRDPFIEVDGPYSLPGLHDYQRKVVGNVRSLIQSDGALGGRRGMISMPTGSGKTRVAVQAVVEAIREDGFDGGILWVADRDELCEQAVEAWRQVWSSEGTQATQLRISRMWAGQPQPLPTTTLHVIVASIQTLVAKIERDPDSYEFLADFKLLVFDEAHRSVAPTFTSVMQDLGLTRWRRPKEPFLIGLTATPYRGHDERETTRLVNRYSRNRLDTGAFASGHPEVVIRELQAMRILAQADHSTIEGGHFSLSADEMRQSATAPWLPDSVQNRIADDTDRTRRIVGEYMNRIDPDWPTLIFATSVEHSRIVAALLTSKGIKARAVSAGTDPSSRRRIVEEFRAGEIKALVNYSIFREGFDAPKTRAIIVARPVYSPNLYFQMIGRGLRGVKNGGNDRCLILNVRDNISNFKRRLAFSDLDWLWA